MLRRPHHRRAGFSLTEVLVALFLVSAGLIALLTLFPLGAIQMGYAFRDDRSQQTALQADAKVRDLWRRRVLDPTTPPADLFFTALNDPDDAGPTPAIPTNQPHASYPVLFDPIGFASYPGSTPPGPPRTGKRWGVNGGNFPRRTTTDTPIPPPSPLALQQAMNYASLVDDMDFAQGGPDSGTPANRDGEAVKTAADKALVRQGRFNWAAVIQRPDSTTLRTAELKILVFDRRAPGVNPTGVNNNELAVTSQGQVSVGQPVVILNGSNETLGLRTGSWIMDGTIDAGLGIRNAHFYRVTAVDDTGGATTTVELHTPIVRPRGNANLNVTTYTAQWYIFRELIDVYDRPPLAPNGYQPPTP